MPRRPITLLHRRFGSLVVTAYLSRNSHGNSRWACVCDCGCKCEAYYQNLVRGNVRSCGCGPKGKAARKTPAPSK